MFDLTAKTFPTQINVGAYGDSSFDLVMGLGYGTCGAPAGMGLWCALTDPNSNVYARTYDDFGRVIATAGPDGAATAMLYHDADRGTADQRNEIRIRWDPTGPADPSTDANAYAEVSYLDGLGRPIEEQKSGRGTDVASRMSFYDAAGRLAQISRWDYGTAAVHPRIYGYDAIGRLLSEELPDGTAYALSYQPREAIVTTTIPMDGMVHRRAWRRDAHGRLAEVDEYADPQGSAATTAYSYDPFGQLAQVDDAVVNDPALCGTNLTCPGQRHVTTVLYDELGNRIRLDEPDSGTWLTYPDARGLPTRTTDPRGKEQAYTFDPLGRLTKRRAVNPDTSETDDVYTYGLVGTAIPNGLGRLVAASNEFGSSEFEYSAAGPISTHTRP